MIVATAVVFAVYFILMIVLLQGWRSVFKGLPDNNSEEKFITVILPVRNEEANIVRVLNDLVRQEYTTFEIIVVNDHSEDNTETLVSNFKSPYVKCIQNEGTGKKHAITTGISVASGMIVATTDADCAIPSTWLSSINRFFSVDGTLMTIGPVAMSGDGTLFSRMQQIEFASLIGTAASTAGLHKPTMCNGANLAFSRDAFIAIKGFEGNMHIASGDDEFLMRKIHSNAPGSVRFMADAKSIVKTIPQKTVKGFFYQRLRWAGKWKFNSSLLSRLLAVFVVLVQLAAIVSLFKAIETGDPLWIILLALKGFIEVGLLVLFCRFLRIRFNSLAFTILFIVYPFYILYVAIVSSFGGYEWKGRFYKNAF
jgi:poly-beta-1,6-N-acetyl-D-glucosamine synthase